MPRPRHEAGLRLADHELEEMLERAAEEGARRALSDVGLLAGIAMKLRWFGPNP